jgi:glyoxylase-like metal-dependent hydrolase (beta-lactamase superfamily II)
MGTGGITMVLLPTSNTYALTLVSFFALCAVVLPGNAQPMVRGDTIEKVSEHVYVIPDASVPGVPNVGIVVGNNATLIIDTGMGKANGEIILQQAKKLSGDNQLYLVTTHIHPEHDLGANGFPASTKMIRAQSQIDEIAEEGMRVANIFRKRSEAIRKLLADAKFRNADIIFNDEYQLDLGNLLVKLIAMGPNHTAGDTAIYIQQNKVLFAGDIAMKALPSFASPKSSLQHWLQSLSKLEALQANLVIPSHGPNGGQMFISDYRRYLITVRTRTMQLKSDGKTLEEVISLLTAELEQDYGNSTRIAGAIRAAYTEFDSGT